MILDAIKAGMREYIRVRRADRQARRIEAVARYQTRYNDDGTLKQAKQEKPSK